MPRQVLGRLESISFLTDGTSYMIQRILEATEMAIAHLQLNAPARAEPKVERGSAQPLQAPRSGLLRSEWGIG